MNAMRLSVMAATALLVACTARDMGTADANLATLVVKQLECRKDTDHFSLPYKSLEAAATCESVASGLVSLSLDAAEAAGETGIDPRNAVFFYRRAATAAWQSHVPEALADVAVYASAGLNICDSDENIQAGDCALLAVLPALAGHDAAARDLAALKQVDYLSPAGSVAAATPAQPAETRLGDVSRRMFEAWRGLRGATSRFCAAAVHPSLRGYVRAQDETILTNLQGVADKAARLLSPLPLMTRARYDTLCEEMDGTLPDVRLQDASESVPLASRLHGLAWCQWQRAVRYRQKNPDLCAGG